MNVEITRTERVVLILMREGHSFFCHPPRSNIMTEELVFSTLDIKKTAIIPICTERDVLHIGDGEVKRRVRERATEEGRR